MRYIIPAFFVCHYDTKEEAEEAAAKISGDVNQLLRIAADNDDHLLLDEERETLEVPGRNMDCELPHTCGNESKAVDACVKLCQAYDDGKESEHIEWDSVDEAYRAACDALGREE